MLKMQTNNHHFRLNTTIDEVRPELLIAKLHAYGLVEVHS